ncbi:MAG TPA: FtsX-like permease family protein [Rhodanobacteraceae bacterium]
MLRQTTQALGIGIANTFAQPRHVLLTAFGLLVAGITLLVLLTIPAGLQRLAGRSGMPDVAMVLSGHAITEASGSIAPDLVQLLGTLPGIAHTAKGQPMVAPQFVVKTRLRRMNGSTATVLIRGVTPMFWQVAGDHVKLASGQRPRSGVDQLLAGVAAARGFAALDTGATVTIHKAPWHVSGEFTAGGGFWESQLWANMAALQGTYNAQGKVTSVWVKLTSPAAFKTFAKAVKADARLKGLQVVKQSAYYQRQTGFLDYMVGMGTRAVGLALGLGAILATLNALALALAARRRQLAVLRSIGLSRMGLALALLCEVLVIAVVCTCIVTLIGWFAVNGYAIGSSTFQAAIEFQLHVSTGVIWRTLVYLLILAAISAAWPIWSAVRAPLTKALQDE